MEKMICPSCKSDNVSLVTYLIGHENYDEVRFGCGDCKGEFTDGKNKTYTQAEK